MSAPDGTLPAYLVTGEDAVLRGEAVRELVQRLVGDDDPAFVVEELDGDDVEPAAIVDAAQTPPFLGDRRVVVAREMGRFTTEAIRPVLSYLEQPLETTALVLVAGGGALSRSLVNAVKKVGHVVGADAPSGKARRGWLDEQMREAPIRLEAPARALVEEHLGEDLGRLRNLLAALAAAYGADARVGADDVRPFLGEAGSVPPWELTDAIDRGDTAAALGALHRMLAAGDRHPLQVMATLHGHFARILRLDGVPVADEATAAQLLGLRGSTFPAKKALAQSRRLGHDGIVEAFRLLADADLDLRGVKGWPEDLVLEVLVARLSRLGPRTRSARRSMAPGGS